MKTGGGCAPAMVAVLLAGCVSVQAPPGELFVERACSTVSIPSIPLGSDFTYGIEGRLIEPIGHLLLTDWRVLGLETAHDASLYTFPAGSSMRIHFADTAAPRLWAEGEEVDALQVSLQLDPADLEGRVHAFDYWFAEKTGALLQDHNRLLGDPPGELVENGATNLPSDLPGPFLLQRFAGEELDMDWSWDHEYAGLDSGNPYWPRGSGHIAAKVLAIESPCTATVQVDLDWYWGDEGVWASFYEDYQINLTFAEGVPVPIQYETSWNGEPETGRPLSMRLLDQEAGSGPPFPKHTPRGAIEGLRVLPAVDGLPQDPSCRWGTCLHDALAAIQQHPKTKLWFQGHPDARPLIVNHLEGEPDGPYTDMWRIYWTDETEGFVADYRHPRELGADGLSPVRANVVDAMDVPPRVDEMVDLDTLAALYERSFGGTPEFVTCDYHHLVCGVNTQNGSNKAPIGATLSGSLGGNRVYYGVIAGMEDGLVYQIDTLDPVFLGPTPAEWAP